jgi:hypothetical protein
LLLISKRCVNRTLVLLPLHSIQFSSLLFPSLLFPLLLCFSFPVF